MKFRNYVYYETDEEGIILDNEPHTITLKEEVNPVEVGRKLGVSLKIQGDSFDYDISETEFRQFMKGKSNKFEGYTPTFRSFIN